MREGEPGNTFYMVAEGTVRVERGGSVVATLRAGGSIGEGALLTSLPRSATVVTNEPAVLFALARPAFVHLTGNYPEVRSHLQRLHDERQRSNLQRLQPA
jgi:CRP-like cAMP-binding protein